MANISLSDQQIVSLVNQLPQDKKRELIDHLLLEEWLDSPEGQKLMQEREGDFKAGKTLTHEQLLEKLKLNG